ncbi:Inner membrane protein YgaP [Thalassoglobus neptunius]|uniref:Inner membrane protein YgaP n=1 Tax=Thalassoglobus neptunius TaxID=1938619 RepID=A0A5C5WJL1_9PLAN|nr:rhodanese-like domain-containing protein [Thalassoglobus neptunius]TWT50032.1 Inner membrane protein YgaP [Thalassoglobus neptunius]
MTTLQEISPSQLEQLQHNSEVELIDIRSPVEFREVHASGARNIPLDTFDAKAFLNSRTRPDDPVYVICKGGNRGKKACQKLYDTGFTNAVNVAGGTDTWTAAGLPIVRGKKSVSLERQVRIVAGSIVLIGALLALFVHPWFAAIPAFIGAGLTFSGVTDTCGMGLLLARMPWNQSSSEQNSCST